MGMTRKRWYALLGALLVCICAVVLLQWELPQEGLSQETAARLEAIGLDPEEFRAYPDRVMTDLLRGLEAYDFLWASASSTEVTLPAHFVWDGGDSETITVRSIPGQPLELELHAFILLEQEDPDRVRCVRLLGPSAGSKTRVRRRRCPAPCWPTGRSSSTSRSCFHTARRIQRPVPALMPSAPHIGCRTPTQWRSCKAE